jgi:hypothetical protein
MLRIGTAPEPFETAEYRIQETENKMEPEPDYYERREQKNVEMVVAWCYALGIVILIVVCVFGVKLAVWLASMIRSMF